MKLQLHTVLFINLCFRIFLLIQVLKEEETKQPKHNKPLGHWLDPLSERVVLISINGLGEDFLNQNSTPYLQEVVDYHGVRGVSTSSYLETNEKGLKTLLRGRTDIYCSHWQSEKCSESILDHMECKCGMGNIPSELNLNCYYPDPDPLVNFFKFPSLYENARKTCLYILSFDLDPVLSENYQSRLKKIDNDIRLLVSTINQLWNKNKTTYIVTSARGSPIGDSLSLNAPVVAWGSAIASPNSRVKTLSGSVKNVSEVLRISKTDLSAMLCALLGANFPAGLFGIIPIQMMKLPDFYDYELAFYIVKHLESVLDIVDVKQYLIETEELELEHQLNRLNFVVGEINKAKLQRWHRVSSMLNLMTLLWGLNLVSVSASGFAYVFCNMKSLFFLAIVIFATVNTDTNFTVFLIALELLLWFTLENNKPIREELSKDGFLCVLLVLPVLVVVTFVTLVGNQIAIPVLFIPLIFWPLFNGSYRRINPLVLLTRLFSGVVLTVLPLGRTFGEMPDELITSGTSFLFVANFYLLSRAFKQTVDLHMKINLLLAVLTSIHIHYLYKDYEPEVQNPLSVVLLFFAFASTYFASGTLVKRLLKIYLALLVPVQMLSIRLESIFYFAAIFHAFTWAFIEYHGKDCNHLKFYPSFFSVEPAEHFAPVNLSSQNKRQVIFFLIYNYLSYFAIGNVPDLHSYDLYVIPEFIYKFPTVASYFLGAFKFFLPFFITTTSFIALLSLQEKDYHSAITTSVWMSDIVGCFLIIYAQLPFLPAKFSYFVIQQFVTICIILSFLLGKFLLFKPKRSFLTVFRRRR